MAYRGEAETSGNNIFENNNFTVAWILFSKMLMPAVKALALAYDSPIRRMLLKKYDGLRG